MNAKRLLLATVGVGVVVNVIDFLVHGLWLQSAYYSTLPALFRQGSSAVGLIVLDFVFALVFVWVYDRVYGSFKGGAAGGAAFGFYAGVLLNFPAAIAFNLMLNGFPYALSWIWMISGIITLIIAGAVAGMLYTKPAAGAGA
jgi:hypothetical protein